MNIFILSRNQNLYSTSRLVEAAERRGHDVFVKDPLKFTLQVQNPPSIAYHSKPVTIPHAVIPRIGASITHFGLAVVRQFEQMGVFTLNSSDAISCSRDKLEALQLLSRHKVPLPNTAYVRTRKEILKAIEAVGGVPVVIKLVQGAQGTGVVLAQDLHSAQAIIELLQVIKQNILVQKFIEESKGRDIRAFVVGGRVVAAMRRTATNPFEFRCNVHRGGQASPIELPPDYIKVALHAAKLLGLNVAGVDLLESKDGPLINEVNSSPGLEAIERASGVDIADEIIQSIENCVA